jgi:protein-S-isoprenylcysteine O-methyltransferase Ste14
VVIASGILHECLIYWLQWRWQIYSRRFASRAFAVHAWQLGGVWIVLGAILTWILWNMQEVYSFHHSVWVSLLGFLLSCSGISAMWLGYQALGWRRMMKARIFEDDEPEWTRAGIFRWFQHPMYTGSQLAMLGASFALDSWVILIYVLEMFGLHTLQHRLESLPVRPTTTPSELAHPSSDHRT